jgi:hypothetical protein
MIGGKLIADFGMRIAEYFKREGIRGLQLSIIFLARTGAK